jgi:hypothetical protein
MLIEKPKKSKFGNQCSGCGNCCAKEICAIGKEAFPHTENPCPGVVYAESRFWCKIVLTEKMAKMETLIANALGIGKGCCSDDAG